MTTSNIVGLILIGIALLEVGYITGHLIGDSKEAEVIIRENKCEECQEIEVYDLPERLGKCEEENRLCEQIYELNMELKKLR